MMHNHDTNETFIPMTGKWRCSWENEKGDVESVDLNPLDVISFPPGAIRRFENVTSGPSGEDAILMFVIGGDGPKAEFTDVVMKELEDTGVWPPTTGWMCGSDLVLADAPISESRMSHMGQQRT
jgi:hypothetical protein